jgi:hypothetical protein
MSIHVIAGAKGFWSLYVFCWHWRPGLASGSRVAACRVWGRANLCGNRAAAQVSPRKWLMILAQFLLTMSTFMSCWQERMPELIRL